MKNQFFSSHDYRHIIRQAILARPPLTYQQLAGQTRINKSAFSKVMNYQTNFAEDQVFKIGKALELESKEVDYLALLVTHARSGSTDHRLYLEEKIRRMQKKNIDSTSYIDDVLVDDATHRMEYYTNPIYQVFHIGLAIPQFQHNPRELGKLLGMDAHRSEEVLAFLAKSGLISRTGTSAQPTLRNLHLPKDSPVYPAWRTGMRALSMARLAVLSPEQLSAFAVIFACAKSSEPKVRDHLFRAIEKIRLEIKDDSPEQVFQVNIDLVPWTI